MKVNNISRKYIKEDAATEAGTSKYVDSASLRNILFDAASNRVKEIHDARNLRKEQGNAHNNDRDDSIDALIDANIPEDLVLDNDDTLTEVLDALLQENLEQKMDEMDPELGEKPQFVNLLVLGDPGGGKTSIIESWCARRNLHMARFTGAQLNPDMGVGIPSPEIKKDKHTGEERKVVTYLPSDAFSQLQPDDVSQFSVLFIDEINRSWKEAEGAILNLIQDHSTGDSGTTGGMRKYPNFLFTIAAANPPTTNKDTRQLGLALNTRFRVYYWKSSIKDWSDWSYSMFDKKINVMNQRANASEDANWKSMYSERALKLAGKRDIIMALVEAEDNGQLAFSDAEMNAEASSTGDRTFSARTLLSALNECNGTVGELISGDEGDPRATYTKGSFLRVFPKHCGYNRETFEAVYEALQDLGQEQLAAKDEASAAFDTLLGKWQVWARRNKNKLA